MKFLVYNSQIGYVKRTNRFCQEFKVNNQDDQIWLRCHSWRLFSILKCFIKQYKNTLREMVFVIRFKVSIHWKIENKTGLDQIPRPHLVLWVIILHKKWNTEEQLRLNKMYCV